MEKLETIQFEKSGGSAGGEEAWPVLPIVLELPLLLLIQQHLVNTYYVAQKQANGLVFRLLLLI